MKKFLLFSALVFGSMWAVAQTIQLPANKTVSLVFAFPITQVDRGTPGILVQQPTGSPNILFVKAGSTDFEPTNLSIVTSDGSIYSLDVLYTATASQWIYTIPAQKNVSIAETAARLRDNPPAVRGPKDRCWGMEIRLIGLYVRDNMLYFQFRISNDSPIAYPIELSRLYIRDKRVAKRTSIQELPLLPVAVAGEQGLIPAYSRREVVLGVELFTIPDGKYVGWEIRERNGGRHLRVKINNRKLLRSTLLP